MPDFAIENKHQREGCSPVAGIDEAGRGPLAGPVVAAAVILPDGFKCEGLNDSKKLTPTRREKIFGILTAADSGVIWSLSKIDHFASQMWSTNKVPKIVPKDRSRKPKRLQNEFQNR